MIDGNWTQRLIVDPIADPDQRQALETILLGRAGGPWEKLHAFVATELALTTMWFVMMSAMMIQARCPHRSCSSPAPSSSRRSSAPA